MNIERNKGGYGGAGNNDFVVFVVSIRTHVFAGLIVVMHRRHDSKLLQFRLESLISLLIRNNVQADMVAHTATPTTTTPVRLLIRFLIIFLKKHWSTRSFYSGQHAAHATGQHGRPTTATAVFVLKPNNRIPHIFQKRIV